MANKAFRRNGHLKESFYCPAWENDSKLKALTVKDEKSILKAQEGNGG